MLDIYPMVVVGVAVGRRMGAEEGRVNRETDGKSIGASLGQKERLAWSLGGALRTLIGLLFGSIVGSAYGTSLGTALGTALRIPLGAMLGRIISWTLCRFPKMCQMWGGAPTVCGRRSACRHCCVAVGSDTFPLVTLGWSAHVPSFVPSTMPSGVLSYPPNDMPFAVPNEFFRDIPTSACQLVVS